MRGGVSAAPAPTADAGKTMTPSNAGTKPSLTTYLQVAPLTLVLIFFFLVPVALVLVVSFFRYQMLVGIVPDFTLKNYVDLLSNPTTWSLYLSTVKFTLIVLAITFVLGFLDRLFPGVPCPQPVDRDRAFPGLHGSVLDIEHHPHDFLAAGAGHRGPHQHCAAEHRPHRQPISWLLYSDFSVVVAYVHLYTLFMIVPIFNSMARIDKSLLEAAIDAGGHALGNGVERGAAAVKNGIALGALFVVTLVMGDFSVVTVMSGGLSGSATSGIFNDLQFLNYPRAAANAVILLIVVLLIAIGIFRIVDVRKELVR